jgi:oligopeptide/dipeptide ABC transporter ATP-binding protein
VSLSLGAGRTIGLVGESGSGKSTIARTILGIYPPTSGRISIDGEQIAVDGRRAFSRSIRRKVQMIFQDPSASLDPRMTVRALIAEPITVHRLLPKPLVDDRVVELLNLVGLHKWLAGRYPHELSGGQRQRVAIARALAVEPSVLVCDEPVSALDVSLQAQVINLFSDLQVRLGISYLFIAHDLAVVRHLSHEIVVLYLGRVMEKGPATVVCDQPLHPYTHSLISAVPVPDPAIEQGRERILLRGDPPSPINPPSGCPFHTRCPVGPSVRPERQICRLETPPLSEVTPGQMVACHFPHDMDRASR